MNDRFEKKTHYFSLDLTISTTFNVFYELNPAGIGHSTTEKDETFT